eukprot:SAG25_NODE_356_length_9202_cov_4.367791_13_plen_147_part_00
MHGEVESLGLAPHVLIVAVGHRVHSPVLPPLVASPDKHVRDVLLPEQMCARRFCQASELPPSTRPILTEICLCHACSCHQISSTGASHLTHPFAVGRTPVAVAASNRPPDSSTAPSSTSSLGLALPAPLTGVSLVHRNPVLAERVW